MTLIPALLIMLLACALASGGCQSTSDQVAVLETGYGRIVIEFLPDDAPRHVETFQSLIRSGFMDGTRFHRVIPKRVIQGGDPNSKDDDPSNDGQGQPGQATIPAEFSPTLKHVRGIVSAAHKGDDENSATSQFFICTGNERPFDGKYSIFGRVIDGMNVVDLIAGAPLRIDDPALRERPVEPVTITRAYLSTREALGLPPKGAEPPAGNSNQKAR